MNTTLPPALVFMGVAGCGKSSVGQAVSDALHLPLIEGDTFHPEANREKMRAGIPLTDADRAGWLEELGRQLAAKPDGVLLACSALKRAYRDVLRRHRPDVRFVFLDLDRDAALKRVSERPDHFFSPKLIDSQFATLERPEGEPGVLTVSALAPLERVVADIRAWLA
jgi:gluconokinase